MALLSLSGNLQSISNRTDRRLVMKKTRAEFGKAVGFNEPTQLPRDEIQRGQWQAANKAWWESAPMRYDWREKLTQIPGSEEYFREIDGRFLASVRKYMPWKNLPFEQLIPFDQLRDKDVLEIGVGQGTHAELIAKHCRSFTGIDLTAHAAEMTSKRFRLFKLPGNVLEMDAEEMGFANNSFDFIWSWGVIHHSADTRQVLKEMHRVLRPNGKCVVMVYHRSWWNSWVVSALLRGLLQGELRRHGSLHRVGQAATDGAIARSYTPREWRAATDNLFNIDSIQICGLKTDVIPLPHGRLKSLVESVVPDALARFFTNRLEFGSFLVAQMRKK
jgi:ubiquinone/menaquinone biosynthesis C-methylase UbiE